MRDPSAAMQEAIYAKLAAASALTTALGGVSHIVDKVPAVRPDPMVRIGEDQSVGDSNQAVDVWEYYATFHIFSRDAVRPRMVVKELMDLVAAAIGEDDDAVTPAGYEIQVVELTQQRSYYETDGITVHGILTFRYLVVDADEPFTPPAPYPSLDFRYASNSMYLGQVVW